MKNLLNIVLIASVLFIFGCKSEKAPEKTSTIEPAVEQVAKQPKTKKPLNNDMIQKINTSGEVNSEALEGKKIDLKKTKALPSNKNPEPKSIPQQKAPEKINTAEKTTSSITPKKDDNQPKVVQVAKKTPIKIVEQEVEKPVLPPKPSHAAFDKLLKSHVSASGNVDYKALKGKHDQLKSYLSELSKNPIQSDWSRDEKLAFWINAYNGHTIDLILNNYPLKSITDLDGGSPWKVSRIEIEGKKYSLDQIENKIIRPQFKDARIHFAVNCAAKSCPSILNGAFLPATLNTQLNDQTKKFVNNPSFNSLSKNSISVSKIFEWYAEDFGNLIEFLNKYSTVKISDSAEKKFSEYDWALNGQ